MKQYFPADHVVAETLQIYQELLGLKFAPAECSTWHKDVTCYTVADAQSQELMGQFYLDLYPREGKFDHAACFPLATRHNGDAGLQRPIAAMVTNFDPPPKGKKATMAHEEVVTFFHEFGHVMHNMCQEVNYALLGGFGVESDFVELPSQMLENWVWDKQVLQRLSKHVDTGKPMPDELIEKKLALKNHNGALQELNQLFYASFDFVAHSETEKSDSIYDHGIIADARRHLKHKEGGELDTAALWQWLKPEMTFMGAPENTHPAAAFGHIYGGYESRYYGYMWSLVYAQDLFAKFEAAGIMNPEMGMRYRKLILAPGSTKSGMEMLVDFLGREPTDQAYLKANGFK